ncbi:MAG: pirin family protein [Pseudanabaena sp.]|nr:MAG: pirin family protein [Pseudanabaena sp.]
MSAERNVIQIVRAEVMSDRPEFRAYSLGRHNFGDGIDPFIQLDHFYMRAPIFPPHPHAGFSAVTYMFEDSVGSFQNRDSLGDHALIHPGDLHWTQAGSGIIHEEVPSPPGSLCHGAQIFVNLAAKHKWSQPVALHLDSAQVPEYLISKGGKVRVVVGTAFGLTSPLQPLTPVTLLDVTLPPQGKIVHTLPSLHHAFVHVIEGSGEFGAERSHLGTLDVALLEPGSEIAIIQADECGLHYLLGAGAPLNEPIVSQGPFVMNTAEEIQRAAIAYQSGRMGCL